MSYTFNEEKQLWCIEENNWKTWFSQEKEAHCYELGYNCDYPNNDCKWDGDCGCCESCG